MEGNTMSSNIANDNVVLRENIQIVNTQTVSQNEKKSMLKEKGYQFVKRIVDIIGGLVGTILLVPITIAIWIGRLVTKENDGPIFYEQLRIGKNGKQFRLYKYRSMVIDADKKLEQLENAVRKRRFDSKMFAETICEIYENDYRTRNGEND